MSRIHGTYLPDWDDPQAGIASWQNMKIAHRRIQQVSLLERSRPSLEIQRRHHFDDILPEIDELRFLHPHPLTYRELARAARKARRVGWNQALLRATITGLDITNDRQWRWLAVVDNLRYFTNRDRSPVFGDDVLTFPEGIPVGVPSAKERLEFHPATSAWDVEDAAFHELELGAGGMAELLIGESTQRAATITRVRAYKAQNLRTLPDDPFDPHHWGHDARLRSLVARRSGAPLELSPAFDPEITAYTVIGPIAGVQLLFEVKDASATTLPASTAEARTVAVTAADGTTVKTYTVSAAAGDTPSDGA